MNWCYKVQVSRDPEWYGNGLVFATRAEAEGAAADKFRAWTQVQETRVEETEREVNYQWSATRGVHYLPERTTP